MQNDISIIYFNNVILNNTGLHYCSSCYRRVGYQLLRIVGGFGPRTLVTMGFECSVCLIYPVQVPYLNKNFAGDPGQQADDHEELKSEGI